ncbi:MAG: hypothetical protein AAFR75_11545 [Pseudomonadota bacterium]
MAPSAIGLITPHLEPGETIVWHQRAPRLRLGIPMLLPLTFFISWTLAALGFSSLILWSQLQENRLDTFTVSMTTIFVGVGSIGVWWCWRAIKVGGRTVYAVTDRAALIIEDIFPRLVRRFKANDIAKRSRWGDRIAFRPDVIDENAYEPATTFIGIKDIDTVEEALNQIASAQPRDWFGNLETV